MEIASSWKFYSENKQKINISELTSIISIFSPDNETFCHCTHNSIIFISKEKVDIYNPKINPSEEITCISTAFSSPWVLSIGTSEGRVLFYDRSTNKLSSISPDSQPVKFIKMCSYKKSYFTEPYPTLFIHYPHGIFATIERSNLLKNIQNNTPGSISFTKWQLSNSRNIRDSIVVNSKIPFPIYSNLHRFPAVYSVGNPFISVSSIPPEKSESTNFLRKAAQFFKWISQESSPEDKEEIPVMKTNSEWCLNDDKREGTTISADPTGRWAAICDNMYRVIIIDTVFGHITKVLKGYRDAQVAWFSDEQKSKNPFLIIYVPTREIIIACTIPNGNMVAAVKVVRDGKLFQTIDDKSKYGASFVYPTGDVININVTATVDDDDDDTNNSNENSNDASKESAANNDSFDNRHFAFPTIATVEKDHSIQELQKLLLQKKYKQEDVKNLASKVSDKIVGGYFIKILAKSPVSRSSTENEVSDDDFLIDIVNVISTNLKVKEFDGSSREFFDSCFSSVPSDGESDLTIYKVLTDKWIEYSKFERLTVSEDQYPQTNLTDNYKDQVSNVIDCIYTCSNSKNEETIPPGAVRRPSLRAFLTNPLKYSLFFFSFLRSNKIKMDSIFDSFRFSRENRTEFILQLLIWIIKCQPAQLLLTQEAITEFLNIKIIKSAAVKQYRKLEIDPNTFQAYALSSFLSF